MRDGTDRRSGVWPALRTVLIALFFAAPLLSGLVNRAVDRDPFTMPDYGAIACGAEKLAAGEPLYETGRRQNCEGYESPAYLYPPFLAGVVLGLQASFGPEGARALYFSVYLAAIGYLLWTAFLASGPPGARHDRFKYIGLITATPIWFANVALIVHAVIVYAAQAAMRRPAILMAVLVAASMVKLSFLTCVLVFACLPMPVWKRIALSTLTAIAGIGAVTAFMQTGGEAALLWRESLAYVAFEWVPGNGAMGWAVRMGAPDAAAVAIALVFAALVALSALLICEQGEADVRQRVFIGLAAAVLAMPRIMPYDVFLLAPGMVAIVELAVKADARLGLWARRAALAGCVGAVVMSLAGYADQRLDVALALFAAALFLSAWAHRTFDVRAFLARAERSAKQHGNPRSTEL
ncbi:MAG: hypothetical protein ABL308_01055 [Oceanicaulis sp.]